MLGATSLKNLDDSANRGNVVARVLLRAKDCFSHLLRHKQIALHYLGRKVSIQRETVACDKDAIVLLNMKRERIKFGFAATQSRACRGIYSL